MHEQATLLVWVVVVNVKRHPALLKTENCELPQGNFWLETAIHAKFSAVGEFQKSKIVHG